MKEYGIFGLFRYGLALLVIIGHFWPQLASKCGTYAVFAFYSLSGYLMTYVIQKVYGTSLKGIKNFLINRFLRIYPLYWIVLTATFIILKWYTPSGPFIDPSIQIPSDFIHWLVNLQIIGLAPGIVKFHISGQRLVSVAWSLHVELCFYFLMGLVLARREWIILLWFFVSFVYTIVMIIKGYPWQDRYFTLLAASLPFSIGACIRLLHNHGIQAKAPSVVGAIPPLAFIIHALSSSSLYGKGPAPMEFGFYLSLFLAALSIWVLGSMRQGVSVFFSIDRWAGDMSYPLFLVHVITGMLISSVLELNIGTSLFFTTVCIATLLSHLLHVGVEAKIEQMRARIRKVEAVT